jgi:xylulokinase
MNTQYLLGVDIGTSSSKGVIIATDGGIKAVDLIEHGISIPKAGWAEHDAEEVWWGDFCKLLQRLTAKANIDPQEITGIGVSGLCPDLLLVDKNGNCIRPAILYGIDARANKQIDQINSLFGAKYIYDLIGHALSSQSILPKMLWLKENEGENFKKAHKVLTASSYIVYKLTNSFVVDYLTASTAGLVNINTSQWVTELFSEFQLSPELLPRLGYGTEIAGKVTSKTAREMGLKEGIPVIIGTGDVGTEAISAGVFEPGETILVYGSTISYLQCLKKPVTHANLFSGYYALPNSYFIGGATATAGALTKWFRDNFSPLEKAIEKELGRNAYSLLSEEAGKVQNPTGIIVLPYLSGARSPVNDENAKGIIAGLTLAHKRIHLYKALLEGVGYEIRHNFEVMAEAGVEPKKIIAVGGGTKSSVWTQIVSDIIGKDQYCIAQDVGAPLGAAYLAGLGVGIIPNTAYIRDNFVKIGRVVRPSSATGRIYDQYYRIYRSIYEETKNSIRQLAQIVKSNSSL